MNADSDRLHSVAPKKRSDFWLAFVFALIANLAFLGLIIFSVSWRNPPATPVTVDLYVPPPVSDPQPPKIEPQPIPEPPKVEPPKVEPPPQVQPDPDIALKKEEEERKKKEAEEKARLEKERLEKERIEKEKQAREKAEREEKERKEKAERERKAQEEKARKEKEERERKAREEKARKEAEAKRIAEAEKAFQRNLENQARENALSRWKAQIQAKVRGNVNLPPNIVGNPEAIFEVTQLPTGEVINVRMIKSSGNAAYDDAIQRAILKSSPLPLPERKDIFDRRLILNFKPHEN